VLTFCAIYVCVVPRFITMNEGAILESVGSFENVHYKDLTKGTATYRFTVLCPCKGYSGLCVIESTQGPDDSGVEKRQGA
jgi:hypothetical protein